MSFRKKIKLLNCNTINDFQSNKLKNIHRVTPRLNYQKHSNRNERFCPNIDEASSIFYMIPEIIFLVMKITILFMGIKYTA